MRDVDKALSEIVAIRSHIAAGTAFQGYGAMTIALTGGLALATAVAQWLWLSDATATPLTFFGAWIAVGFASALLIGSEMLARSRRHHSGLSDALIHNAVERFLPAAAAGVALTLVLFRFAPDATWALPGLWQMLISLGLFASLHSLPRPVVLVAAWYFVAGLASIVAAADGRVLSPWIMGLPFALGQGLFAIVLHLASGDDHAES